MVPSHSIDLDVAAGADALRMHRDSRVGADRFTPGKYAVYFYDLDGEEFRTVGGYPSVKAASDDVDRLRAEACILRATEKACAHEFQMHPVSEDFGVCSKCGHERTDDEYEEA